MNDMEKYHKVVDGFKRLAEEAQAMGLSRCLLRTAVCHFGARATLNSVVFNYTDDYTEHTFRKEFHDLLEWHDSTCDPDYVIVPYEESAS
jgi:hypothetical protein